ncbi:hypothetical protein DPMN_025805 [Dreissena polymorpha]|uniref:Uncharacterized protein n=1 Tax=Dreissena polymorpha TaxID=45954 RepID=A0A9D4RDZ3_DREPO|nr:hypothetical protein DPMN_025805 [Dreissena polymorpha]
MTDKLGATDGRQSALAPVTINVNRNNFCPSFAPLPAPTINELLIPQTVINFGTYMRDSDSNVSASGSGYRGIYRCVISSMKVLTFRLLF